MSFGHCYGPKIGRAVSSGRRRHANQRPGTIAGGGHDPKAVPKGSWWAGLDRAQLAAAVEEQMPRMKRSKFGNLETPTIGV